MSDVDLRGAARALQDEVVDVRRALHARPELAFEEHGTTALIRERARALGIGELPCPTSTGALLRVDGARPGRTVLLRADIDALPLDEEVASPFRSTVGGVMHACGHDGHVAMLLGVAAILARHAADLAGRFVLLFQPAEELAGGARAMIDAGVLDGLGADALVSAHLASPMPTGFVAMRAGIAMSGADVLTVRVRGQGAHGALAGVQGNVVLAVSALAQALPGTVAGLEHEGTPCACSPGVLRAGEAANVVPSVATLKATLRTYAGAQREDALGRVREACAAVAKGFGVTCQLDVSVSVPPVVNDAAITAAVRRSARAALGEGFVLEPPVLAPSDDVSEFLRRIPGCHLVIGAMPDTGGEPPPMHHAPDFRFDERAMETGVVTLAAAAIDLARQPPAPPAGGGSS